jgi:hypothetical protein
MATNCTGNVNGVTDFKDVPTDSHPGRYLDVSITRCTQCAGSAYVTDSFTSERWLIDLPADYARDDYMAAYWAVETSQYREPVNPTPPPVWEDEPVHQDWDEFIEDEDGSEAYARMLERRAEAGTWFGGEDY